MDNNSNRQSFPEEIGTTSYEEASRYSSRYSRSNVEQGADSGMNSADPLSRYSRSSYGTGTKNVSRGGGYSYEPKGPKAPRKGGKGGWRKPLLITLVVVLVLALGGAGAAFAYINSIDKKLQSGVDDELLAQLQKTQYNGDPFYVLLLGVDRDEERTQSGEFGADYTYFRTDSMMLARVDPVQKKATLISLPRDTMVDMGTHGTQKLNAAYPLGGPAYVVQVVSKIAGVPISHYAEIDFDGFAGVVDALGGIEVDVPITIDDDAAGGRVEAGYQTLDGNSALVLCRSRHTYDDVGAGDLYRAANQRMVLSAIAKKLLNSDVVTMVNAINVAAESVKTDLGVTDMMGIAYSMRGLDPSTDIYTCCMPTTSQYIDKLWYEVIDQTAWSKMMKRVDKGLPPTDETVVDETTGTILSSSGDGSTASAYGGAVEGSTTTKYTGEVAVRNGSAIVGAAQAAAIKINKLGFVTDVGNADSSTYPKTLVIYSKESQAEAAAAIVSTLGCGEAILNDGSYASVADILVVIGADYK